MFGFTLYKAVIVDEIVSGMSVLSRMDGPDAGWNYIQSLEFAGLRKVKMY